ncbi:MAG TPA: LysE family transporter [Candidatus Thermoplasmatota archaeon]|nr:LysE family transporter [Candidatus Thermoplasmatota archaeon]
MTGKRLIMGPVVPRAPMLSWPGAIAAGFALGLSLAIPPGPVNALIAREAVRGGAWAGVRAGYPAPVVDTTYMLLVLLGLPRLVDLERWAPLLAAVGVLLMLYLAWDTTRVRAEPRPLAPGAVWAVTLSNPFQYAWWVSAGAAFLAATAPWGVLGFLAAIFGWVLLFSFAMAHGAARWSWFTPFVVVLSADLLLVFAVLLAQQAATGL